VEQMGTAIEILTLLRNRELVTYPFVRKLESTNPARFLYIYSILVTDIAGGKEAVGV